MAGSSAYAHGRHCSAESPDAVSDTLSGMRSISLFLPPGLRSSVSRSPHGSEQQADAPPQEHTYASVWIATSFRPKTAAAPATNTTTRIPAAATTGITGPACQKRPPKTAAGSLDEESRGLVGELRGSPEAKGAVARKAADLLPPCLFVRSLPAPLCPALSHSRRRRSTKD